MGTGSVEPGAWGRHLSLSGDVYGSCNGELKGDGETSGEPRGKTEKDRKTAKEVGGNHKSLDHSLQKTKFQGVPKAVLWIWWSTALGWRHRLDRGSFSKRTALHLRAAKALPDREVQVLRKKTAFPKKSRCNAFVAILFSAL